MDNTNLLNQIDQNQAQKEVTANENFAAASPAMLYARNAVASIGLTWGYTGGRYLSAAIANGTLTLAASVTTYIVVAVSTGVVSQSTATTNWNDTTNYVRLYKVVTGATAVTSYEDHRQTIGAAGVSASVTQAICIASSDETTALTTGTSKVTFRMPFAFTLSTVKASLTTAQGSGSIFTVDLKKNGTTIFSTKLTIDNTSKTTATATTPSVISSASLSNDDEMTVDIVQIGTSGATGLKVYLIGTKV